MFEDLLNDLWILNASLPVRPARKTLPQARPKTRIRRSAGQLQAGVGSIKPGNQQVLTQLASVLVEFDAGFEVMPGTR